MARMEDPGGENVFRTGRGSGGHDSGLGEAGKGWTALCHRRTLGAGAWTEKEHANVFRNIVRDAPYVKGFVWEFPTSCRFRGKPAAAPWTVVCSPGRRSHPVGAPGGIRPAGADLEAMVADGYAGRTGGREGIVEKALDKVSRRIYLSENVCRILANRSST